MSDPISFAVVRYHSCDDRVSASWLLTVFVPALTTYLVRDVSQAWELLPPTVLQVVYARVEDVPPGAYALVFQGSLEDVSPGVLAYHTEDPSRRVFAPIATVGFSVDQVGISATHEAAEALLNPGANRWVDTGELDADGLPVLEAFEGCDRCEEWSYAIGAVACSDFLTRAAFDTYAAAGTPLDFLGHLLRGAPGNHGPESYVILRKGGSEMTDPPGRRATKHASSRAAKYLRSTKEQD